ncbi:unnamed protein product [Pelagomonas calceolata]|uniref:Uncharacterized protein n=1 Tax=Pelagomonas calceolata TaxID=35677 RepID=A0A7S4A397_9STRA|nr:unnamed protein product [Pelagomonas calceolata]
MGSSKKPRGSKADLKEADRESRCLALLEEVKTATPFPDGPDDLKNKSSKWTNVDATNVHNIKKIIATLTLADVPTDGTFRQDGGKGTDRGWIGTYVRFLINDLATQKRKAKDKLDKEERKKRGECDLLFADLDQPAREAAWRAVLFKDGKVTMGIRTFEARAGNANNCQVFWKALKEEEKAATVSKAKADGEVREMTREVKLPDALVPGQEDDGAMPFGAGGGVMSGAWLIGDLKDKYIIGVVEKAAARRGVSLEDMGADWARALLKIKRALEMKLRRVGMTTNARCVTTALTTGRDFTLLGVRASERALVRLVARLREAPTRDARDVVALRDWNRGDARACLTACGDAPRVGFGAAAGGVLGGGAASRGWLQSGRVGAARLSAMAVSDEAPASLGDAYQGYDWARAVVESASKSSSASREPLVVMTDTGSEVSLDLRSPTFLADYARLFSRNLGEVPAINAALDKLGLHETPGGEGGLCLLDWGLMAFDPLTGKGVAGPFIETCEDIDAEESKKKEIGAQGKFYAPKILHLALQKAILSGKLHFERDMLTLFYCIFGKLFFALLFYAGRITMLKARAMGFDPTLVPLELPCEDLPMVDPSIAKRFPNGIVIESSDHLLPILHATNDKFFDEGKCVLWALAFAAYYGADHPLARAALAAVGARKDDHERAASRVAACKKAIDALATGGGSSARSRTAAPALPPPPPPVMKRCGGCAPCRRKDGSPCNNPVPRGPVQGLAATDGAAAAAPFLKFPSLEAALDAAKTPLTFQIRFAVPATGPGEPPMTKWYSIGDFAPVMNVLSSYRNWDAVRSNHSWVLESETCRAMEAAACASSAIFAGMRITEIAPPHSVAHVFDPTKECKHDQTYTIWAGVDFEIMLPGGRVISKSEFLLQELEKYMAARA